VDPAADDPTIKKAFHSLAKVAHPDKTRGLAQSEYAFDVVKRAFDVLKDPIKRIQFNMTRGVHMSRQGGDQGGGGVGNMQGGGWFPGGVGGVHRGYAQPPPQQNRGYQNQSTPDNVRIFNQMQADIKKRKQQAADERLVKQKAREQQVRQAEAQNQRFKFRCPECTYHTEINGDDYADSAIILLCNICNRKLKVVLPQKRNVRNGQSHRTPHRSFGPSGAGEPLPNSEVIRLRKFFQDKRSAVTKTKQEPAVIDLLDSDDDEGAAEEGSQQAAGAKPKGKPQKEAGEDLPPVPDKTMKRMKSVFKFPCPRCTYFTEVDGADHPYSPVPIECNICAAKCHVTLPNKPRKPLGAANPDPPQRKRVSYFPTGRQKRLTDQEIRDLRQERGLPDDSGERGHNAARNTAPGRGAKRSAPEVIEISDDEDQPAPPPKRTKVPEPEIRNEDLPPGHPRRVTRSGSQNGSDDPIQLSDDDQL